MLNICALFSFVLHTQKIATIINNGEKWTPKEKSSDTLFCSYSVFSLDISRYVGEAFYVKKSSDFFLERGPYIFAGQLSSSLMHIEEKWVHHILNGQSVRGCGVVKFKDFYFKNKIDRFYAQTFHHKS